MSAPLTIQVVTVVAAVEIIAEPGDLLMMLNGACVGVAPRSTVKDAPDASSLEDRLLGVLRRNVGMTAHDIGRALGVGPDDPRRATVSTLLGRFADAGAIVGEARGSAGRRSRWRLA